MNEARVIIVDDNRDLADNICEILGSLQDFDARCYVATSGQAAVEIARGCDVDLALIDLHLPDTQGTELIADLRELSPFCQVVIITGDATIESAIRAVREGAFAYVLKPFRVPELVDTARRALAQTRLFRDRAQLRQELERSEQRHREIVEAVPAFVLGLDGDGRIVIWNSALERVTGFDRSEMLGQPGSHLVGQDGEERRLSLKNGGHRLVRWQRAELGQGSGQPVSYALGLDVTEEKQMLRRTLRAERLAAVGTLAAGLAHEVRNPLNSALLQLNVLERRIHKGQTRPDELEPVTHVVQEEIRRLDRLVSDFLAFAQPRPLDLKVTSINDLLKGVVDLIAPEAETQSVDVSLELDSEAGELYVEPERLRQVLLNLFRNGIEAMREGGRLVARSTGPDDQGNVRVVIEDSGPGFPEDAPVFDAFYTTKEGGTGLGLAIVHRIVSEHGGQVHVDSRPGRTAFTLSFPQHVESG